MTDDCPRVLRKVRDRCKAVSRMAIGLVSLLVSLPSAFAQSLQTADPAFNVNQDSKYPPPTLPERTILPAINLEELVNSVPPEAWYGDGGFTPEPNTQQYFSGPWSTGNDDPFATDTGTTTGASTEELVHGMLLTRKCRLPNVQSLPVVVADPDGHVIRLESQDDSLPKKRGNRFLNTEVSDYYLKAQAAMRDGKTEDAGAYLKKALQSYDRQKDGDPAFRKLIESELNILHGRQDSTSSKSVVPSDGKSKADLRLSSPLNWDLSKMMDSP